MEHINDGKGKVHTSCIHIIYKYTRTSANIQVYTYTCYKNG